MIKIETLFKNESSNETLKKTYQVNQEEVYISFKKGMVRSDEYYMVGRESVRISGSPRRSLI